MKTIVINLWGGPGCGKSTLAAELFTLLKRQGASVELVREYAKGMAYENRAIDTMMKQVYILAKQTKAESMLYGKVDYIVTDSPIFLSGFYSNYYMADEYLPALTVELARQSKQVHHMHFLLPRNKPYVNSGRFQNEDEAKLVDAAQAQYLNGFPREILTGEDKGLAGQVLMHAKYARYVLDQENPTCLGQ